MTIIYTNYVLRIKSERIKVNCLRRYQKTKFLEIFIFEQFFLIISNRRKYIFFSTLKNRNGFENARPDL